MSAIGMRNVAVMSVQYLHYSFDYFLSSMERCGLRNVELWGGAPHYCRLDYGTSAAAGRKVSELRRKLDERGMKVVVYTPETLAYPYSFSSPERPIRDRTVDYFAMAFDDALGLGTDHVFINSGCGLLDLPREESWKRAAESFRRICDLAERRGITLVLEQLQPYESNLVTTCADQARMLGEVGSPALQACVDVVAMEVVGERLSDFFEAMPDRIRHIHYADGDPSGHYILGDGKLPLRTYVEELERRGYSRYLTLEINDSIYWADPHASIERSTEYLRGFLPE
ncbi:MAG TPA: TIM barrel protein [Spirochaetales bacterium]|nr:TIM barrel protein [Spirochaetales bacterium]HRY56482.1 TIM barrel protein [Spirochaetia bacterium]HRZ63989.1 TIM barrel protein [Spirochaetia bacterium]